MTLPAPLDLDDDRAVERTELALAGRALFGCGLEMPCETVDLHEGALAIACEHVPEVGKTVIAYLDVLGRLEGPVLRAFEGRFVLDVTLSERKQAKLAAHIATAKAADVLDEALPPIDPTAANLRNERLQLADGRSYRVQITDLSLAGAAMLSAIVPRLNSRVEVAGLPGRVVQHYPGGLRVDFERIAG